MVDKFVLYDQQEVMNTTFINLFTTTDCQLNCTYCIEKTVRVQYPGPENVGMYLFGKLIQFIRCQGTDKVMFHFYGGEPTLHPDLRTYVRILKDEFGENIRIKLSTNLEREMEYFDDLPDYVEVWASYHHFSPDWHKKVMMLQNRKMLKKALLMCDVTNYDTIYKIVKILKPKIDCIKISPIDKFRRASKYSYFKGEKGFEDHDPYEDYEILDIVVDGEKYNKVPNVEDFNNFEGYLCNAGFDVYPDGAVKYCSRDDRVLLNLINEEPKKLERLHVCRSKDCPCDPEFGKYSMKYYLREILKK